MKRINYKGKADKAVLHAIFVAFALLGAFSFLGTKASLAAFSLAGVLAVPWKVNESYASDGVVISTDSMPAYACKNHQAAETAHVTFATTVQLNGKITFMM